MLAPQPRTTRPLLVNGCGPVVSGAADAVGRAPTASASTVPAKERSIATTRVGSETMASTARCRYL